MGFIAWSVLGISPVCRQAGLPDGRQVCLFLVGYLFTQRAKDGVAPIERIWPEATETPLYRLLNDPFGVRARLQDVKKTHKMADESVSDLLAA